MAPERRAGLGHLHQGKDALLHSGPAGTGKENQRQAFLCGPFRCPGDFLSHSLAHAGHKEASVHDAKYRLLSANAAFPGDNSLPKTCLQTGGCQFFLITRVIQRISACQIPIPLLKASLVCHPADALPGMDAEISLTSGTYIIIFLHILGHDSAAAHITFGQKSFGDLGTADAAAEDSFIRFLKYMIQIHMSILYLHPIPAATFDILSDNFRLLAVCH